MSHDPTFDERQAAWATYTSSPWARIRHAVVAATLEQSLTTLGAGPLHILDVGGGDGLDSLALARAGHDVTILDPSESMLAGARGAAAEAGVGLRTVVGGLDDLPGLGTYDVVLCHFVLQYRPAGAPDIAALVGATRPGGLLSIIMNNPVGVTLSRLVREGPAEALAELRRETLRTVTFEREVRKVSFEQARADVESHGCEVVGRYGGRIANDLLTDDDAKRNPEFYADLERLELALCDQEPYRRIGAFWQLVARSPG